MPWKPRELLSPKLFVPVGKICPNYQSFNWLLYGIFIATFKLFLNPFVPSAPFLCPLKTLETLTILWCFQGVEKGCIGNECVAIFYGKALKKNRISNQFYSVRGFSDIVFIEMSPENLVNLWNNLWCFSGCS